MLSAPFNSSSNPVNAIHQSLPSSVFTDCIFILPASFGASTAMINCPASFIRLLIIVSVCASISSDGSSCNTFIASSIFSFPIRPSSILTLLLLSKLFLVICYLHVILLLCWFLNQHLLIIELSIISFFYCLYCIVCIFIIRRCNSKLFSHSHHSSCKHVNLSMPACIQILKSRISCCL